MPGRSLQRVALRRIAGLCLRRDGPRRLAHAPALRHPSAAQLRPVTSLRSFFPQPLQGMPPPLRIVVLLGSTRTEGPPKPTNVGRRVGRFIERTLIDEFGHTVDIIDPLREEVPLLRRPHFAYAAGRAPEALEQLAERIRAADGYVACTPEYNHAPSPALLNVLNHFGSSLFSFKPSAIVSYSAGQFGGARAAMALRPTLCEVGCLPVSAMVHVPHAHDAFDADGHPPSDEAKARWASYASRTFSQLTWWASAARAHRAACDPFDASPAFVAAPRERDAP